MNFDLLKQAATTWNDLCNYEYKIVYGYKKRLFNIAIKFDKNNFYHLAGFHYAKDVSLPKFSKNKIVDAVLCDKIKLSDLKKSLNYETHIESRLRLLAKLNVILDSEFNLYTFMNKMLPFYSDIRADYLITSEITNCENCSFIIRNIDYYNFCSVFENKGPHFYSQNQRKRTIMQKIKINKISGEKVVLINKLSNNR